MELQHAALRELVKLNFGCDCHPDLFLADRTHRLPRAVFANRTAARSKHVPLFFRSSASFAYEVGSLHDQCLTQRYVLAYCGLYYGVCLVLWYDHTDRISIRTFTSIFNDRTHIHELVCQYVCLLREGLRGAFCLVFSRVGLLNPRGYHFLVELLEFDAQTILYE